jgi:hypothetical protein
MIDNSRLGNFLYLLSEMEVRLELGSIEWTAATAVSARERLIAVTSDRRRACYPTLTAYEPLWDQRHPELIGGSDALYRGWDAR